jgi:hypothetical protein
VQVSVRERVNVSVRIRPGMHPPAMLINEGHNPHVTGKAPDTRVAARGAVSRRHSGQVVGPAEGTAEPHGTPGLSGPARLTAVLPLMAVGQNVGPFWPARALANVGSLRRRLDEALGGGRHIKCGLPRTRQRLGLAAKRDPRQEDGRVLIGFEHVLEQSGRVRTVTHAPPGGRARATRIDREPEHCPHPPTTRIRVRMLCWWCVVHHRLHPWRGKGEAPILPRCALGGHSNVELERVPCRRLLPRVKGEG